MAPEGTVTVTLTAEAAVTVARVAPKNTMLLLGVTLKLVPVRVTTSPGLALRGLKEVMVGSGTTSAFRNTETVVGVHQKVWGNIYLMYLIKKLLSSIG